MDKPKYIFKSKTIEKFSLVYLKSKFNKINRNIKF